MDTNKVYSWFSNASNQSILSEETLPVIIERT